MRLTPEQQHELARFPATLRGLVESELAAGNSIVDIGHSHPAPPVGAYVLLARKINTRVRATGDGLLFRARNSSSHSGEITDAVGHFFVLEAADPPPLEPDMEAIRAAHAPRMDARTTWAERPAGAGWVMERPADTPPGDHGAETGLGSGLALDTVAAVQAAIVDGLKRGGTFSTAHKEGGTTIAWRNGRFVRSDYGDFPDLTVFTDEAEFLSMLRRFCEMDVTRETGKKPISDFEVWTRILQLLRPSG